jgi:predicted ATPase/class 3 adenylate cyclase/DNA-binding XRE family transcriptional regulator
VDGFSFGEWLRQRRSALLLSREDLAQQVGCAVVTLRKIEADERRPSQAIAERLADLLELSGDERTLFVQVARGLVGADRLPPPIPRGPAPAPFVSPTLPPAAPILPSGTVTFLFTDIEGSTQLWEQHPQGMPSALARHDAVLQQAITAHDGVVFKTVGDAVYAAFARAPDASVAALAAQRVLQAEGWGATGPLRVRMALHTGVAEERAGDYFGPPLNRLARLLAAGHGSQILLSLATAELVREHLPPDTELRDLGSHRLKDLSYPEQIFQLVAPDLPVTFPPLNTLDARHTNLPAQPTLLIGREQEVASICGLLRREEVRLLTLTGPGGTGKTRLGLQVAAELFDDFAHGVYFVNLAPISDPSLVASAIAQTLEITETGDQPLPKRLQSYLRNKRVLLVLDNFEQIVDAAPLVAELLVGCPQLTILVTSRVVLHLRGEKEIAVQPLALPDLQRLPPADQLTQYAAVALFIQRALDVQPDFTVTNANAPAVAEICARLDGLPLAIELAAARLRLFAPEALLARLGNRLALLTGGARDLPARQQTLRSAIAWSYDLLESDVQTLFARLGVFVGGCTPDAAQAVCKPDGDLLLDVLDGLATLVDNTLLRREDATNGEPRFVMLETIREYALEQLTASGQADTIRHRHAAYFLALAEAGAPAFVGVPEKAWLDQIAAEHDNLRAALAWAFGGADAVVGMRLAGALAPFWVAHEHGGEDKAWLATALATPAPTSAAGTSQAAWKAARAAALLSAPELISAETETALHEALTLFREVGDTQGIAWTIALLGRMEYGSGNEPQAISHAEESLALFQDLGDKHGMALSLHTLGDVARDQGDVTRAATLLEESLALCRELGYIGETPMVLNGLGDVPCAQGDYLQAMARYWEAVALCQQVGDRYSISMPLRNLGWLALVQGDDGQVLPRLQEQVEWLRDQAAETGLAFLLHILGAVVNVQGDTAQATKLLREGLILQQQLQQQFGQQFLVVESLERFAGVAAAQDQPIRAARLLGAAEAFHNATGMYWPQAARAAYAHTVAAVRAQLDAATLAAAWAEGQAMTLEQAIAEALSGDDRGAESAAGKQHTKPI